MAGKNVQDGGENISEEIPLCKICLEPITNFVCPNCLLKAVVQWMKTADPNLVSMCKRIHIRLVKISLSQEASFCVVCKKGYHELVCVYDYIKEFYSWLEFVMPEDKAEEFIKVFSFGYKKGDYESSDWRLHKEKVPIGFSRRISDMGLCEGCENFSENIEPDKSNCMMCEDCR